MGVRRMLSLFLIRWKESRHTRNDLLRAFEQRHWLAT